LSHSSSLRFQAEAFFFFLAVSVVTHILPTLRAQRSDPPFTPFSHLNLPYRDDDLRGVKKTASDFLAKPLSSQRKAISFGFKSFNHIDLKKVYHSFPVGSTMHTIRAIAILPVAVFCGIV
jgi:hypothetical protein